VISDPGLAHDVLGIGWILFNLLVQCADVCAEVLCCASVSKPPNGLQQLGMRQENFSDFPGLYPVVRKDSIRVGIETR
jgi:hypothetical protein